MGPWDNSYTVKTIGGLKENVLLSAVNKAGTPFLASGLEAFFVRISESPLDFNFFVSGDDLRYLGNCPVDHEQTVISQAEWKLNEGWGSARLNLQHFYQHQVFDVSPTEENLQSILARAHLIAAQPAARLNLGASLWAETAFNIRRQFIVAPLDNYWEGGPEFRLGTTYARRSELSLGYSLNRRSYDTRLQVDTDSLPIPGEALEFLQHKTDLVWRHFWDPKRTRKTTLRAGLEWNLDNGPGYFDYLRSRISLDNRVQWKDWACQFGVAYNRYEYRAQTVDLGGESPRNREKNELTTSIRLEYRLSSHVKAVAAYEHENFFSNQTLDTYRVHTVSAGVEWDF